MVWSSITKWVLRLKTDAGRRDYSCISVCLLNLWECMSVFVCTCKVCVCVLAVRVDVCVLLTGDVRALRDELMYEFQC